METTINENKKFISKLNIKDYELGSFDVYLETTKAYLKKLGLKEEEIEEKISSMPYNYRAAIIKRKSENELTDTYIGYIGISDYDALKGEANLLVSMNSNMKKEDYDIIVDTYIEYLESSLNISVIKNIKSYYKNKYQGLRPFKEERKILIPKRYIKDIPTKKELSEVNSWGYNPKLNYMRSIYINHKFVGVIGLTNVSPANRRASLSFYLNPNLGNELINEFGEMVIDEYLEYAHEIYFYNINAKALSGTLDESILNLSSMKKFAEIGAASELNNQLVSSNLYQHISDNYELEKIESNLYSSVPVPSKKVSDNYQEVIELGITNFKLIRPRSALSLGLDFNHLVDGHIEAMQNRNKFTIPLGEDKYFLQRGNEKYGIYKSVLNFSYLLVDNFGNYAGYVNILRQEGRHVEIEMGISPNFQGFGLGTRIVNAFYDELFRLGYVTITSQIFEFNKPSLKLHEKVADFNGIRINSYFANGELHNMHYYTKTEPEVKNKMLRK